MADMGDLYEQGQRQHEERYAWHQEAMHQYSAESDKHLKAIRFTLKARVFVELIILILVAIIAFK